MSPKQLAQEWVSHFNKADVDGLASLYAADATNHQVVMAPCLAARPSGRCSARNPAGRK